MRRRIASVWLPRLETDLIARRRPVWREKPLALYRESGQRLTVVAANAPALTEGVAPGMAVTDARAILADLATLPCRPARVARALQALLRWLDRFTPLVGVDGQEGFFLDMTGACHLFGGEAAFLAELTDRLEALGFAVQAAMADTPGAAWALARHGGPSAIAPPGRTREALAPLPVAALRLPAETRRRLERLGLARVQDLAGLPRQTLTRRFGLATAQALDRALGAAPEPISPMRAAVTPLARLDFAEPISARPQIEAALERLIDKLAARLALTDQGADHLALTIRRLDGGRQTLETRAAQPTREAKRLKRLFAEKLDRIEPGFGVEAASLAALGVGPLPRRQADALQATATAGAPDALAGLLDTLGDRLGFAAVAAFAPEDCWRPDRSFLLAPAGAPGSADREPWPAPPGPRPLRLLKRPAPLEVEAPADPLAPPEALWRAGARRAIRHATGPERIAPEWAASDPDWRGARDYWRAEDETGERLWLYRENDAWFLHGLFA